MTDEATVLVRVPVQLIEAARTARESSASGPAHDEVLGEWIARAPRADAALADAILAALRAPVEVGEAPYDRMTPEAMRGKLDRQSAHIRNLEGHANARNVEIASLRADLARVTAERDELSADRVATAKLLDASSAKALAALNRRAADAEAERDSARSALADERRERVGIWRCCGCGAGLYAWELPDTRWRSTGGGYEHQCGDPQAGCEPADFFAWSAAEVVAYIARVTAERDEALGGRERVTPGELLRRGGEWLGTARSWMQRVAHNGGRVTWGSSDLLQASLSVRDIEELAADVASIAMSPQPSEERLANALRARWTAEQDRDSARSALSRAVGEATDNERGLVLGAFRDYLDELRAIPHAANAVGAVRNAIEQVEFRLRTPRPAPAAAEVEEDALNTAPARGSEGT